jgi:hypothetical protein
MGSPPNARHALHRRTDPGSIRRSRFHRFEEIAVGLRFVKDSATGKFSFGGDPVKLPECFPMAEVSKGGYKNADVATKLDRFDQAYTKMINQLQSAWHGKPDDLDGAVATMRSLRKLATDLIQIPIPGGTGNYGPCFRFISAPPAGSA